MKNKIFYLVFLTMSCTRSVLNISDEFLGVPDADFTEVSKRVSLDTARTSIQGAVLTCSPGACPDGVGLLAAVGETNHEDPTQRYYQMETCTVTFVKIKDNKGQDQLYGITAGHCIPKRLQKSGSVCSEDISIKLIKGSLVKCESVDFVSAPDFSAKNTMYFDVALIKVSTDSPLTTYEISQKPLKDSLNPYQVKMLAADPLHDEEGRSQLRETECWYLQNSYIVPDSTTPTDPLMITRGCALKSGNSGAPLLDGGDIVGIQSNYVEFKDKLIPDGIVTIASNLYCLDIQKKSLRCDPSQPLKYADEDNGYHMPSYVNLLKKRNIKTLDASSRLVLDTLANNTVLFSAYKEMEGFSKVLVPHDFKMDYAHYVRIPFPNCYNPKSLPAELKEGMDISGKNVVVYGLKLTNRNGIPENRFKLSIYQTVHQPDLILYHRGNGVFRIASALLYQKFADISLNPCR